jgi:hypothetical protein
MEAHYSRSGHDGIQLFLLATGRGLFLECHDSITGRIICHQAVAGGRSRSNVLETGRGDSPYLPVTEKPVEKGTAIQNAAEGARC